MIKALTPLPIRVLPIDGESLASYLDRISATLPYAISLATLYYNLGLQATVRRPGTVAVGDPVRLS